jgi:Ca2+-binding EF-hand superfamily protein
MSRCFALGIFFTAALVATAEARDDAKDKKRDADAIFTKLDGNKDDKLSKDEFLKLAEFGRDKAKAREFLGKVFDKLADRQTNALNRDQFKKFLADARKKKGDSPKT